MTATARDAAGYGASESHNVFVKAQTTAVTKKVAPGIAEKTK